MTSYNSSRGTLSVKPLDSGAMRKTLNKQTSAGIKALGPLLSNLEEYWTTITLLEGWESRSLVVRPKSLSSPPSSSSHTPISHSTLNTNKKHPLIVYFYGGGWTAGTPAQCTRPARDFAQKFNAVVVCPDYRLVPEVRWPVPLKDGYDILLNLAENAESEFGATLNPRDGGGFIVGGDSAGASIAAVAWGIAMSGDDSGNGDVKVKELARPITGLCICIPWL